MDATFAAMVAGFFSIIITLISGVAFLHKESERRREADEIFRAEVRIEVAEIKSILGNEYLQIAPHMKKHEVIEGRLDQHGKRIRDLENEVLAMKAKG